MTLDLRDRPVATLVGAATVVVVAVVLIIAFALVPYPDLPTVADQPEPALTTELAFIRYDRQPCIGVVGSDGSEREVVCDADAEGFGLRWVDAGTLEFRRHAFAAELVHIDVATGTVTVVSSDPQEVEQPPTRSPGEAGSSVNAVGDRLSTSSDGGATTLEVQEVDGTVRRILSLDGPTNYELFDPQWSGDGAWIVVRDSVQRIIVVRAEGEPVPRLWTEDVDEVAVR